MANPNMKRGMPSVNPKGRTAGVFHTLSDTRSRFLETLTRSEILAIAADDEKLDKYPAFQAQVLVGLAESLQRTPIDKLDPSKERERLYDRELGQINSGEDKSGKDTVVIVLNQLRRAVETVAGAGTEPLLIEASLERISEA